MGINHTEHLFQTTEHWESRGVSVWILMSPQVRLWWLLSLVSSSGMNRYPTRQQPNLQQSHKDQRHLECSYFNASPWGKHKSLHPPNSAPPSSAGSSLSISPWTLSALSEFCNSKTPLLLASAVPSQVQLGRQNSLWIFRDGWGIKTRTKEFTGTKCKS